MRFNKEADLVMAIFQYAVRCYADNDVHALRTMNFGPRETDALRELRLEDLRLIGRLRGHCLHIRLDRDVFWPMLKHLERERAAEVLERELIKADAPLEMMRRLFGLDSHEYTRLRRELTPDPGMGRPPEPEEAVSHAVWRACEGHFRDDRTLALSGEDYLALRNTTGASLRAIWTLTERWNVRGDADERAGDRAPDCTPGTDEREPPTA